MATATYLPIVWGGTGRSWIDIVEEEEKSIALQANTIEKENNTKTDTFEQWHHSKTHCINSSVNVALDKRMYDNYATLKQQTYARATNNVYYNRKQHKETNQYKIEQRFKQIALGKQTLGYQNFLKNAQKNRQKPNHVKIPYVYQLCSKRSWDGQIRKWRRYLHTYDNAL